MLRTRPSARGRAAKTVLPRHSGCSSAFAPLLTRSSVYSQARRFFSCKQPPSISQSLSTPGSLDCLDALSQLTSLALCRSHDAAAAAGGLPAAAAAEIGAQPPALGDAVGDVIGDVIGDAIAAAAGAPVPLPGAVQDAEMDAADAAEAAGFGAGFGGGFGGEFGGFGGEEAGGGAGAAAEARPRDFARLPPAVGRLGALHTLRLDNLPPCYDVLRGLAPLRRLEMRVRARPAAARPLTLRQGTAAAANNLARTAATPGVARGSSPTHAHPQPTPLPHAAARRARRCGCATAC